MSFDYDANFKAVGQGSGTTVTQSSGADLYGSTANVTGNAVALYKTLPTFTKDTSGATRCPSSTLSQGTESEVYCLQVSANANADVALYKLTFDATPNLLNTGSSAGQLANASGWKIYEYDSNGNVNNTVIATGTWASNSVSMFFTAEEVISKNTTSYYVLKAPIAYSADRGAASASLTVRLAAESSTAHLASTTAALAHANSGNKNVWSDMSDADHSSSADALADATVTDWTDSYKLEYLSTDRLEISEP